MSRKNGFYFWIECKDVFVVTDRKNKTTHLAQQICEKMGYPASQNNISELLYRLSKATYQIKTLTNGRSYYDISGDNFSCGNFVDENNTIIIDLNK